MFEFTNRENREVILPGALIYQYNISALAEDFQKNLDESPEAKTIRWLRYFAKDGRAKRLNE